ncbi:Transcriptional regulator, contains XRE-family HTH domain [Ruminococcaceae bacterium YRB3002]|nr:Transcriptional regulator, contains XRE-family HTH domain [Ruminococcaceae bacterium YRB3002]
MIFSEKLQILRKNKGLTQEALADKLGVSRQAVAKWEAGQVYPDISNLIQISELMNVSVDYLVKDQDCAVSIRKQQDTDIDEIIDFRLEANVNTYAAFSNEVEPTRPGSHDFRYENGRYMYHDTYVGGERFAGEEAVWRDGAAVYAMNYMGRVLGDGFSGNFLKEALRAADRRMPYRGPEIYQSGEYTYRCRVTGDVAWFQGYEEIYRGDEKVYECVFHGGLTE